MAFWRLYYHLVWATKNREYLIEPEIEAQLFPYLISKAAELGMYIYAINGWYDHIHLIAAIPPKLAVADAVKRLKGSSAYYLNHNDAPNIFFAWQRGYGVLSLGEKQRPRAEAYVRQQKEHHQNQTVIAWLEHYAEVDESPNNQEAPK